VDFLWHENP